MKASKENDFASHILSDVNHYKKKFFLNNFFSKFHQIHRRLQISSYLLKTSLMKNFIFDNIFDSLDDDSDDEEFYNEKDANGSEITFFAIQRRYI